ncbi:MAG: multifunctional CCA addition/repair protein [Pseudomonadota bacterium]
MDVYLVGGAVRDELLGLAVRERDWVVVGGTADALRARGFRQVGKDFPVFLHPDTGEEYALARTEKKSGHGYHGFSIDAGPAVTLEDDLGRRDLTINAMARAGDGTLIDPWGGRADLDNRTLRHVTPAFADDPLRVLRVARFAARFRPLGFDIADETRDFMRRIAASGELEHLRPERVWQETERALAAPAPQVYFEVLRDVGALAVLFPEIDALYGVPQPAEHHPEIDTGIHTMLVLAAAAALSDSVAVRFAALTHDLGKGATPRDEWPKHHGHEARSVELVETLARRLPVPKRLKNLALLVAELHGQVHKEAELRDATVMRLLQRTDALRRPGRFEEFLLACEADSRGRPGYEDRPYPQAERLRRAVAAAAAVTVATLDEPLPGGAALGEALRRARIDAIRQSR